MRRAHLLALGWVLFACGNGNDRPANLHVGSGGSGGTAAVGATGGQAGLGGTGATTAGGGSGGTGGTLPSAGGASGLAGAAGAATCTQTLALAGDVFDPQQVYLLGTLSEGACYLDAAAHIRAPNSAATGFDCYFDGETALIRPTDGRLVYVNTFDPVLRTFTCDACPYSGGTYPTKPLANDTVLPTTPCDPNGNTSPAFVVGPDGTTLHSCASGQPWYDEGGNEVYDGSEGAIVHLGYGKIAMTASSLIDLGAKTSVPITGLPAGQTLRAIRAVPPDAFWVVVSGQGATTDPAARELWRVEATGAASLLGAYPAVPSGHDVQFSSRLDACGGLVELARDSTSALTDEIVRRELSGTSEVVYSEASDPLVKIHISYLATGP